MRNRIEARREFCGWMIGVGWLLSVGLAQAQEAALVVQVGKSVERNVGYARGWSCDDPDLITATLITRGDHNVWTVTGEKTGSTACRVGTDPYGISFVFNVRVVRPRAPRETQAPNQDHRGPMVRHPAEPAWAPATPS